MPLSYDETSYAMKVRAFFVNADLDRAILRPLSHIYLNWELMWDDEAGHWEPEPYSFAGLLNELIEELASAEPPIKYHDHEDRLAEYVRDGSFKWNIKKVSGRWIGIDYHSILQQGSFHDLDQRDLILAAAGRVRAAIDRGQLSYDQMEEPHRVMLATVMSIILYQRSPTTD